MRVDHKLLLRLFLIDFCLFYSQFGKSIEISFNLRLLLRLSAQILAYSWYMINTFLKSFSQIQNTIRQSEDI